MLQSIRDRAQGWLAWTIVILIIVPFALWGIQEYFGGGREPSIATVNDTEISQRELQMAYLQQRERLQQMLGENFRPEMFSEAALKQQILDQLVEQEVVVQTARNAGFRVSDEQLAGIIRDIPAFQEAGKFSPQRYEQVLRSQGLLPGNFEAQVRRDLVSAQLQQGVIATAFATEDEQAHFLRLQQQKRDIGYFVVPVKGFVEKVEVTDGEIEQYYQSRKQRFVVPEQVRIAFVELDLEKMGQAVEVSEEALRARYEERSAELRAPEERSARHILVKVDAETNEETARKEAEQLLARLRAGESFEKLAKEHSDDPGSAKKGGDLGFFGRGMMVKPFEESAFAMKPGDVSDLVRSDFGYHIIRLDAVRGGEAKPFDAVREELLTALRREQVQPRFYEQAEQLANLAYEHPEGLQVVAEELNLPIQQSGFFSRTGGKGLTADPKIIAAAFSEDVLAGGNNSEPVELSADHLVVLRVLEHKPESVRPLAEVREQVVAELRQEKARAKAGEEAVRLAEQVRSGQDPEKLAKAESLQWQRHRGIDRNAEAADRAIVRTAFSMARPEGEAKPTVRSAALGNGDQAVVVLYAVREEGGQAGQENLPAALEEAAGQAEFNSLVAGVRARADVKMRGDNI